MNVLFWTIALGMLLAALDQTIVATALPTIVGDLGAEHQRHRKPSEPPHPHDRALRPCPIRHLLEHGTEHTWLRHALWERQS